jgi:hypothetical protein
MNPFAPFKPMMLEFGRAVWFGFIFLTGILVAFAAQDDLPNPTTRFWDLFWVLCFHVVAAALYFRRVRHWSRWPAICITVAALISFSIMTWKVSF